MAIPIKVQKLKVIRPINRRESQDSFLLESILFLVENADAFICLSK